MRDAPPSHGYTPPIGNFFLFTGENEHELRSEKRRWIEEFERKHGGENIVRLQGKEAAMRSILDEISVLPFLAERRLVVIDGMPRWDKEEVGVIVANLHPQTVLLIADPKPDKRLAGTKEVLEVAEVKTFAPLKGKDLETWVRALAQRHACSVENDAMNTLLLETGTNQDMLEQEVRKLCLYAKDGVIRKTDILDVGVPSAEGVVWTITDLLAAGKKDEASRYARTLLVRGGDAFGVWAILLNMLKNVAAIAASVADGNTDQRDIAQAFGIHPFVVRTLMPYARRVDLANLRVFLDRTADDDIALKTGAQRSTDEWPQELLSLIDRFLLTAP